MVSTRLDAPLRKMEAQPAAEMVCFLNKIEDGQSPKQGDCVSEKLSIIREGRN